MSRVRTRRRARTSVESLTGAQRTNLIVGRGIACDWTDTERRACWASVGDALADAAPPMQRPAAWWEYQQGIPADLRKPPESRGLSALAPNRRWPDAQVLAWREAQRARAAFLVTGGHLRPVDVDHLRHAASDPRNPEHSEAQALVSLMEGR